MPFDRHDWTVDRCGKEVRYVIDFYFYDDKAGTPEVRFGLFMIHHDGFQSTFVVNPCTICCQWVQTDASHLLRSAPLHHHAASVLSGDCDSDQEVLMVSSVSLHNVMPQREKFQHVKD